MSISGHEELISKTTTYIVLLSCNSSYANAESTSDQMLRVLDEN